MNILFDLDKLLYILSINFHLNPKNFLDIDRLVVELEEQCRINRTAESLQSQVDRLEAEVGESQKRLRLADENQKRAEALLAARMEEKEAETGDLNGQIKWFRQEYDALLLKVRKKQRNFRRSHCRPLKF